MDRFPLRTSETGRSLLTTLHSAYSAGWVLLCRSFARSAVDFSALFSSPSPSHLQPPSFLPGGMNVLGSFSCPTIQDFFFFFLRKIGELRTKHE